MSVESGTRITLTTETITVGGVLSPGAATDSLLAQLPLEVAFRDFGGQEKLAALPAPLDLRGTPAGTSAEPGMIGYYAPDQVLVLYYASVGYFTGIVALGTFEGITVVRESPAFTATLAVSE